MLKLILYNIFRKLRALAKLGNINCSVTLRPNSRNRSLSLRERGVYISFPRESPKRSRTGIESRVIRTHTIPCRLPRARADRLNQASGRVYSAVLVAHWRVVRKKHIWLSETAGTRWSDRRTRAPLHAHSIDAAQQGFYQACATTR